MPNGLRYLLLPIALLYGLIIYIRNWLYDNNVMKSAEFDFPVISVGNLSFGGTGKTPHVEYLIRLLSSQYNVAVLSRGYARKTNGYQVVEANSNANDIGDEPMLLKMKYPQIAMVVAEDRVLAIPQLLSDFPAANLLLMDDAMQHRAVQPGMSIAITAYNKLFTKDYILPMGTLREPRSAYKRADFIIVSKCPPNLRQSEKAAIKDEIKPGPNQAVLFSYLQYGTPYSIMHNTERLALNKDMEVLLFCAIATPNYLEDYVKDKVKNLFIRHYRDHHQYDRMDIENLTTSFNNIQSTNKILLTTEKDAVKLIPFREWIVANKLPIYIIPVQVEFFPDDKELFDGEVLNYVRRVSPPYYPQV